MSVEPVISSFEGDPWDRQRDDDGELESIMWYTRFRTYFLSQGPDRSLLEAINLWRDEKGRKRTSNVAGAWRRNTDAWRWRDRASAWDAEQMRKAAERQEEEIRRMFERHVQIGQGMQRAATRRLGAMIEDGGDWDDLTPDQMRLLAKDGVDLERQARGLPAWLVQIATMTEEELVHQWESLVGSEGPPVRTGSGEREGYGETIDLDQLLGDRPEANGGDPDTGEEPGPGAGNEPNEG